MTTTDQPVAYVVQADRHSDLCQWLRMNGIRTSDVPYSAQLLVASDESGYWTIRREEYLRNQAGQVYVDPLTGDPAVRSVMSELMFDPPMHWLVPHV